MGEVYRARDTRLGREVAIKVLPDDVARDAERLARFEREAKSLAALNHPNVATLYSFEQHGEAPLLVMELVEGPTLADRIARGPIPLPQAVPLFLAIADGLEAAHERGVIHRDLKPANIKIAADGEGSTVSALPARVKILDFGLAKAMVDDAQASDPALSHSPTLTLAATQRGQILGTAAYMSPEQASGKPVDKRADVWAFGACLYEALTGRRAFAGDDAPNTLGGPARSGGLWRAAGGLPARDPPLAREVPGARPPRAAARPRRCEA
jgi:serine/threonine protein kinase